MTAAELSQVLDGLDRRLALGEIDLGTYNTLRSKFSAQSSAETTRSPLEAAVSGMRKEAVALRCPSCMAPMTPPPSGTSTVKCEYCGGAFAVQTAESEMEQLKAGIRKWISDIAGASGGAGHVDEAARRFIFNDKLLPSLRLEANRAVEMYAFCRHQALFSFPLVDSLGNTPFQQAMMALPDVSSVVSRVKTTIARVQDPEVVGFAAGDDAKGALRYLETNCQEIIYLGNARRALASHNADGYSKAVVNLRAAKTLYDNAAKSGTDKSLSAFYSALSERTDAVASGIDLLQDCFSENAALDFDKIAERASHLADLCEGSAVKADQCGRDARDTVPASEGARADAAALRVFAKIVKLYGVADPNRSASFRAYLDNCQALASGAKTNDRSLRWLDEFTNHLTMMLSAMSGQTRLPVVNRFDWAQAKADAGASSSLFGGKETSTIERRIFVPFWLARLCASEQQGLIFKKGRQVEGQLLLDASKAGAGFVRADESLAATVQNALMSRAGFDGSDVIAPAVGKLDASKRLKEIIQSTPELAGAHANLVEIVYLPAACVKYSGKKGTRTASVHFVDAGATSLSPVAKQLGRHHICVAT